MHSDFHLNTLNIQCVSSSYMKSEQLLSLIYGVFYSSVKWQHGQAKIATKPKKLGKHNSTALDDV